MAPSDRFQKETNIDFLFFFAKRPKSNITTFEESIDKLT